MRRRCRCAIPGRAIRAAAPGCCGASWNSAAGCARCGRAAGASRPDRRCCDAAAHSFTWLRDLRALGTDAARLRARALVAEWIAAAPSDALAHRPDVAGARIAAWLGHYDFFAAAADDVFRQRLMARLVSDARSLSAALPAEELDARALTALKGLIAAAVALPEHAGVPDPRAALPAAGDRPPGAAGWLPCRTQPGRAARRACRT